MKWTSLPTLVSFVILMLGLMLSSQEGMAQGALPPQPPPPANLCNCHCPYPVLFLHGFLDSNQRWGLTFNRPQFQGLWGTIADTFHVVLNAQSSTHIGGSNGVLGDNGPGMANDDDVLTWFTNEDNVLRPGCVYAINFDAFWNENPSNPVLDPYVIDGIFSGESDGNESAIHKQGYALGRMIEAVLAANPGKDKVVLIGHSMGGLEAREYLQRRVDGTPNSPHRWWVDPADTLNGHRVAKLLTVGTPHRGSDFANLFGRGVVPDLNSEAVRDLRYTYPWPNSNAAVYLFGGEESTVPGFLTYYNRDVNCNGVTDSVAGLNINGTFQGFSDGEDGTTYNPLMPLPWNIHYTYYMGNVVSGDLIVDITRQWIYEPGTDWPSPFDGVPYRQTDTILAQGTNHVAQLTDVNQIVRGIDEANYPRFAWDIKPDKEYFGVLQMRSLRSPDGPANKDMDWYKFELEEGGVGLAIHFSPNQVRGGRIDFYTDPNPYETGAGDAYQTFLPQSPDITLVPPGAYGAGTYYIRITHSAVNGLDWHQPYTFEVERSCGRDVFEPNNEAVSAAELPLIGVNLNAVICPAGDEDWYRFRTQNDKPNVVLSLRNLARDYQFELYESLSMNLLTSSTNVGTMDEELVWNASVSNEYLVRVFSADSMEWEPGKGYYIHMRANALPYASQEGASRELGNTPEDVSIYPNPAKERLFVHLPNVPDEVRIHLLDMQGKLVLSQSWQEPLETLSLDLSSLPTGMYMLEGQADGLHFVKKVNVE